MLSDSTEDYDRGGKFALYRDIPSLQEVVFISSKEVRLEQYIKQAPNEWKFIEYKSPEEMITINTIYFTTALKEIYLDVDFTLA